METEVPYAVEPRPDTGLTNARLGLWLFLASEVMFFGSLVSAYVLLRIGAPAGTWPAHGWEVLSAPLGGLNTLLLLASSIAVAAAVRSLRRNDFRGYRVRMGIAVLAGLVFLAVKGVEWAGKLEHGLLPRTSTFLALYFTLTGVHALHVLGGLAANGWLLGPGSAMWRAEPRRFAQRVAVAGAYWHFVDAVWIVLFGMLYLL